MDAEPRRGHARTHMTARAQQAVARILADVGLTADQVRALRGPIRYVPQSVVSSGHYATPTHRPDLDELDREEYPQEPEFGEEEE